MDKRLRNAAFGLILLVSIYVAYHLLGPISTVIEVFINLISPFLIGFGFAFIFHPFVLWLEGKKVSSTFAKIIVIVGVFGLFGALLYALLPQITEQLIVTIKLIPTIIRDMTDFINQLNLFAESFNIEAETNNLIINFIGSSSELALRVVQSLVGALDFIIFTPILFMYFLFDYHRVRESVKHALTKRNYMKFYALLKEYEKELHHYVTGTILVLGLMSVTSFLAFWLAGLDNALLFGFIVGLTNILPIIGNPIGGLIATAFALKQSTTLALIIMGEVLILTIVESNFITPLIQSSKVKVHPVMIIFGIVILGYILGFFGVLIAIPIILFLRLLYKYYSIYGEKYKV